MGPEALMQIRRLRDLLPGVQGAPPHPAKVGLRECSHGAQKPRTGQLPKIGLLGGGGRKGLMATEGSGQQQVPRGSKWGQESSRLVALRQKRSRAGLRPLSAPARACAVAGGFLHAHGRPGSLLRLGPPGSRSSGSGPFSSG